MYESIYGAMSILCKTCAFILQVFVLLQLIHDSILENAITYAMNKGYLPEVICNGTFQHFYEVIYLEEEHIVTAQSGNVIHYFSNVQVDNCSMRTDSISPNK